MDWYLRFMFVLLIAQGNWSNCSEKWRLEALEALSIRKKRRIEARGESRKRKRERQREREKKEDAAKERRSPGWDVLRRCREGGLYFGGTLLTGLTD